jgi:hypothetical protein
MFIAMTAHVLLTPSGVKCSNVLRAHGTPDGVRAPRRLDSYKHGPPDGGRKSKLPGPCGSDTSESYKSHF